MSAKSLFFLLLGVSLLAGCGRTPDADTINRLAAADAAFEQATSEEDFVRVAARYQEVLDSGFASAEILYNQGNAWARASENGRAIAAYLQAQQLRPRDEKLSANLALVRQRIQQVTMPEPSLTGTVFVLNGVLSSQELSLLASGMLAAALLCSGWLFVRGGGTVRRMSQVSWAGFLLLASSIGFQWYQQKTPDAVIISAATAFQGPAVTYEAAFQQVLAAGVECVVLSEQGEWCNVAIPDAGEAWLPQRNLQIIR